MSRIHSFEVRQTHVRQFLEIQRLSRTVLVVGPIHLHLLHAPGEARSAWRKTYRLEQGTERIRHEFPCLFQPCWVGEPRSIPEILALLLEVRAGEDLLPLFHEGQALLGVVQYTGPAPM